MTEQAEKYRKTAQQFEQLAELDEEEEQAKDNIEEELDIEIKSFFNGSHVMSEYDEINKISTTFDLNATDAKKHIPIFPDTYVIQDKSIPDLIKKMRMSRRKLKGEQRNKMSKAIDTMIDAYTDHLNKCIGSITWLSEYTTPLKKMRYNEKDLLNYTK